MLRIKNVLMPLCMLTLGFFAHGEVLVLQQAEPEEQENNDDAWVNAASIVLRGAVTGSGKRSILTTLSDDVVTTDNIVDDTITGDDLATDIAISTTGNIATTGTGTIKAAGCMGRTYIAASANSTGNATNRDTADGLCNTANSGSKVCTYNEIVESERCGVTMPTVKGRINSDRLSDCLSWTDATDATNASLSWDGSLATDIVVVTDCDDSIPFLCCE